jgi:hypothetical protein
MARTSTISDEVWSNAIHAVMVDKMSLRNAAKKFGVHHMSLHRRIKEKRGDTRPLEPRAVRAVRAANTSFMEQTGSSNNMSMTNMMQMPFQGDQRSKIMIAPPGMRLERVITPTSMIHNNNTASPRTVSPIIQAATWSKAIEAVEMGQMSVVQASSAFCVNTDHLYDLLKKRADNIRQHMVCRCHSYLHLSCDVV